MSSRSAVALLVLLAPLLAQPALADAGHAPPDETFDPLSLDLRAHLTADLAIAETPPAAGSVALPPTSVAVADQSLAFSLRAPVRFVAGQGFEATLRLRAENAVVARDADGNALELSLQRNGEPVNDSARRVPLDEALLAPGATTVVRAVLQAPGVTFAKDDGIALVVRPLMPGLQEDTLFLVVGEDGSTLDLHDMRVPTLADLELQDAPVIQFLLSNETFVPPRGAAAHVIRVLHDRIEAPDALETSSAGAYVVLRGEEDADDAREHHATTDRARRIEAAHSFRVGATLVRVHPGVGVAVPVPAGAAPTDVVCVSHCPDGGFTLRIEGSTTAESASTTPELPQSVLVPPPRSTSGIPVSKDAPGETRNAIPLPGMLALAALAAVASLGRRRT